MLFHGERLALTKHSKMSVVVVTQAERRRGDRGLESGGRDPPWLQIKETKSHNRSKSK